MDCAARYRGVSLNDVLVKGPDLTNPLVDVIQKFLHGSGAFMADIKAVLSGTGPTKGERLFKVSVLAKRKFSHGPKEHHMTVHPMRVKSSPFCANFALHETAKNHGGDYLHEVRQTVLNNFYVDDCLKSVDMKIRFIELLVMLRISAPKGL